MVQDSGFLMINGEIEKLTAVELKQKVLEILNYPADSLSKKSLIYRYTVYTPQEEMKSILLGKKEDRLDTLRKVFNIDKYKRIQENSRILSAELRGRIKEYENFILDLENLKKEREEKIKYGEELKIKTKEFENELTKINEKIKNKKLEIGGIEEKIKILNELKKDFEINEVNLRNDIKKINENNEDIEKLSKEIKELEKEELKEADIDKIYSNLVNYRARLSKVEGELLLARKSLNECKHDHINSEKLIRDIKDLEKCPTCFQDVNDEHRQNIIDNEEMKLQDLRENIRIYTKKENELVKDLEIINKEIDKLNELKSENEIIKIKIKNLSEKKSRHDKLTKENRDNEELTKITENRKTELSNKISKFKDLNYENIRKELELMLNEEKEILLRRNSLDNELKNNEKNLTRINDDISKKDGIRELMFKIKNLRNFVDEDFSRIIETIEKKVMLRVHNDFNELFIKWFNILVDDEDIIVKLDEEFSPVIEQNGYNVDYLFLSGGEKTAGALAYRLALNQVINNLMVHIKTKDLLILDEPTDGFSEEQLDRVRLVLDELDIKQIILVSHESKIESFVNNVIRLNKKDGVSEVV